MPAEGVPRDAYFQNYPVDMKQVMQQMIRTAAGLGLPFKPPERVCNSRLAQELGLWAESQDRGEAFHAEVFRVFFVEGRNIGLRDVLLDMAAKAGLPPDGARNVIDNRTFAPAVDTDWSLSRQLGITAVPTFVMNGRRLVGAQPYEALAKLVAGGVR